MTVRPDGSVLPTERGSRAGRTLVALWVLIVVIVAALAAWLEVLGPPPGAGTAAPAVSEQPPAAATAPAEPTAKPPER